MPTLAELSYRMPTLEDRSRGGLPVQPNVLDRIFGSVVTGLASLPRRAIESSQNYMATGQYDPEPVVEAATAAMMGGMPFAVRGAVGSAGGKLPTDYASRMKRGDKMRYSKDTFYRGERTGAVPQEFPDGAHFSRDYGTAEGFAKQGGRNAPEEYRLNLQNTFSDHAPINANGYARLVAAARERDPKLAAALVEQIAPGKDVDWFAGFAKHFPQKVVAKSGALVRQAIQFHARNANDLFVRAGYDALDSGRDVLKLNGAGIRSKDAIFDPRNADSQNVMASLAGLGLGGGAVAASYPSQDPR
jgi:hypothetical protein